MTSASSSTAPQLEIERKFRVTPPVYAKIQELCVRRGNPAVDENCTNNTISIRDVYYDFPPSSTSASEPPGEDNAKENQYPLLRNDHWLRKRNGSWELKKPSKRMAETDDTQKNLREGEESSRRTQEYIELQGEAEIEMAIRRLVTSSNAKASSLLSSATPFADLETKRESWTVKGQGDVHIDIDRVRFRWPPGGEQDEAADSGESLESEDFAFVIGEIECIVSAPDSSTPQVEQGIKKEVLESQRAKIKAVEEAFLSLTVTENEENNTSTSQKCSDDDREIQGGKLLVYLRRFQPKLLQILLDGATAKKRKT
ncbi:unnamed protein product [Amoebophrya sp. A25]|nr:unnamed protein product [Amoebophrya sp. A25]|eukprot:GSA25T00025513001.1